MTRISDDCNRGRHLDCDDCGCRCHGRLDVICDQDCCAERPPLTAMSSAMSRTPTDGVWPP